MVPGLLLPFSFCLNRHIRRPSRTRGPLGRAPHLGLNIYAHSSFYTHLAPTRPCCCPEMELESLRTDLRMPTVGCQTTKHRTWSPHRLLLPAGGTCPPRLGPPLCLLSEFSSLARAFHDMSLGVNLHSPFQGSFERSNSFWP